jgi:hypothetical protein
MNDEQLLVGGDINVVVRVGDTVRRPRQPLGVRALLQWYEQVGFDGAPRFLGVDEQGREILSFVEGEPAFAPVPDGDDVVVEIGRLLRRAHDLQDGFAPPKGDVWHPHADTTPGEVIAHNDLFWTNVIFRKGMPAALIDWELAGPSTRALEVAKAATYWAPLRIDEQADEWGLLLPADRRGERLRLLCDAYGLSARERAGMLDELLAWRRHRLAERTWRGVVPREIITANLRWVEEHHSRLDTFLA